MLNMIIKAFGQKLFMVGSLFELNHLASFKTLKQLKGKIIIKSSSKFSELQEHFQHHSNNLPIINQQSQPNTFQFNQQLQKMPFPSQDFNNRYNQFQSYEQSHQNRKTEFQGNLQKELYLPLQEMTKVTAIFKAQEGINTPNSNSFECTSLTN